MLPTTEAATVPLCSLCLANEGLCLAHAKHVLPQLAQPFWYQLVGTHHYTKAPATESPEGQRIRERKERKREHAAERLARATAGARIRNQRAA